MHIRLYNNFAKRKNSTKRPTGDYQKRYEVVLKVDTDYDSPTFLIAETNPNFPVYTYAYIEEIQRYYFITAVKQRNAKCWEIVCELDFLATYVAAIRATSAFVAYSSTDFSMLLNDTRISKLNESRVYKSSNYNTIFGSSHYDYLWVAGTGGSSCYRCNVRDVTKAIYDAANDSLLDNLCQTWADIQSCIMYCRSFSLDTQSDGVSESIQIGKYDTGVNGARLSDSALIKTQPTISIPIAGTYTDFRRYAYTNMRLSLPYVGVVALSVADFIEDPAVGGNVNVDYVVNLASGVVYYKITNDNGAVIASYSGVAGRAKPVSIYSPFNGQGVLTSAGGSVMGAAGALLATTPVGQVAGMGAAIAGVASMFSSIETASGSTVGTNDGSAEEKINPGIQLVVEEFASRIEPSNLTLIAGSPCSKVMSLATLTGYVQTCGASVSVNANSNVIDKINIALDNGIYLE